MSYVHDSRMRTRDWPGCSDAYDAMTGPRTTPGETPWRMHKTFGLHMCGQHVPLTFGDDPPGGGPHCPVLNRETLDGSCTCGLSLTTGQSTLGQITDAYHAHLGELAAVA
jgi:hypothetical protein